MPEEQAGRCWLQKHPKNAVMSIREVLVLARVICGRALGKLINYGPLFLDLSPTEV